MTPRPKRGFQPEVVAVESRQLLTHIIGIPHPKIPTIPIPKVPSEELWGEAGRLGYSAAAGIMQTRNANRVETNLGRDKDVLRPHFGSLVDRVTVAYGADPLNEWGSGSFKVFLGGEEAKAQTYGHRIYVKRAREDLTDYDRLKTLIHELVHAQQYERFGSSLSNFGYNYFKEYKKANQSYENNKLEREAADRTSQLIDSVYGQYVSMRGTNLAVVSFRNPTKATLPFSFRWSPNHEWQSVTLKAGERWYFWARSSNALRPEFNFDSSFAAGFQSKTYSLRYKNFRITSVSATPAFTHGQLYEFGVKGDKIDLFSVS